MIIPEPEIHVLLPTRDENTAKASTSDKFFQEIGHSQYEYRIGHDSIFDVVTSQIHHGPVYHDNRDILVVMHDDVDILSNKEVFKYCLEPLKDEATGFVGVAGTQFLRQSAVWWEGMQQPSAITALAGTVGHGNSLSEMHRTVYGPGNKRQVVVMDGLFLAATYKTWRAIRTSMPEGFVGGWDFYDLYYTFQAHMKGLKNYVMPLDVLHKSHGEISGKEGWHKNREVFLRKYGKHLPQTIT